MTDPDERVRRRQEGLEPSACTEPHPGAAHVEDRRRRARGGDELAPVLETELPDDVEPGGKPAAHDDLHATAGADAARLQEARFQPQAGPVLEDDVAVASRWQDDRRIASTDEDVGSAAAELGHGTERIVERQARCAHCTAHDGSPTRCEPVRVDVEEARAVRDTDVVPGDDRPVGHVDAATDPDLAARVVGPQIAADRGRVADAEIVGCQERARRRVLGRCSGHA